jgi:hypothetical protein
MVLTLGTAVVGILQLVISIILAVVALYVSSSKVMVNLA